MDNLFFYLSKIIWILISPDSLFVILLVTSLLLLVFNLKTQAIKLLSFLTLSILLLSFFSIGSLMLYPLESHFQHNPELPEKVDGIVVLGGSVVPDVSRAWQQLETNEFHERLSSFIELAHRYPDAKLVFSGGNASMKQNEPTEADWVRDYFIKAGIQPERLTLENQARNTAENVSQTKRLINPQPQENWLLITSAFHMPRSVGVFCQQNWPVIPYPVDHKTVPTRLYDINYNLFGHARLLMLASHEWVGLLAYYLSGKINSLVPDKCN